MLRIPADSIEWSPFLTELSSRFFLFIRYNHQIYLAENEKFKAYLLIFWVSINFWKESFPKIYRKYRMVLVGWNLFEYLECLPNNQSKSFVRPSRLYERRPTDRICWIFKSAIWNRRLPGFVPDIFLKRNIFAKCETPKNHQKSLQNAL